MSCSCPHNRRQRCGACQWKRNQELQELEYQQIIKASQIVQFVCRIRGVTEIQLRGRIRTEKIVISRHIAFYLMRDLTVLSFPKIGAYLRKDHATVINGCKIIKRRMQILAFRLTIDGYIAQIVKPPADEQAA